MKARLFLVTGGAGFIGSHIAEALVERGDRVRILDNLSTGHAANMNPFCNRIEFIHGDITDAGIVAKAVDGVDCIFHEAALASVPLSVERPLDSHAACATGTVTLLDAARRAGVRRVVYAASSAAYGDQPASSKRESDLPAPRSPYAAAKLAGELYCQAFWSSFGLETVTIRYFNVFGPRQDPKSPYSAVIPLFITAMLAGQQPVIYGDGRQSRDFSFVSNVVRCKSSGRRRAERGRPDDQRGRRSLARSAHPAGPAQPLAGHERQSDVCPAARRRRAREPGRYRARTQATRLRAPSRLRGGPATLHRLLSDVCHWLCQCIVNLVEMPRGCHCWLVQQCSLWIRWPACNGVLDIENKYGTTTTPVTSMN